MSVQLVLGLGNPGSRYAETRHNVGFGVVDELARRQGSGSWSRYPLCDMRFLSVGNGVITAKPSTFMNRSGAALEWLLRRYSLAPEQVLVVVDDVDLKLGRLRLRINGGPGTHNGLRDLCEVAGTGFPRLRVGVRGEEVWDDLAFYVTEPFDIDELETMTAAIGRPADAVEAAIIDGLDVAMNRFNRSVEESVD